MKTTLSEIAQLVDGTIIGDSGTPIGGVASFEIAAADEITVAESPKFIKQLPASNAAAVIVARHVTEGSPNLLQVDHPMVAFAKVITYFHPPSPVTARVHPSAVIGEDFQCGKDVSIGACAVIGDRVTMGSRTRIHSGAVIGDDVVLGDDVTIHSNATVLERCLIGNRVMIHSASVIGSDGFGFAPDGAVYHKVPHVGIVQIDDDVEIGACNTIDRATLGKTWIGRGVKTDNLVHIAHNVTVGENTLLIALVGVSGSVTIGKHVIVAGQAGIAGHLKIGDRAIIGPQSGIAKDVAEGETLIGAPQTPPKRYIRIQKIVARLPELKKRLEALEKKIHKITEVD
ncbi:MAG: UDP-3-O-(3-hydroxymyristoyl)glucosamine N-acyltransferase [Desulfobacterales bacterium]